MAEQAEAATLAVSEKELIKAAEKRFREDVNTLIERRLELEKGDLMWKHDLGRMAATIAGEEGKDRSVRTYGSHRVDDIADAVGEKKETVYAAIKFYKLFSGKELQHIISKRWPWRGLRTLVSVEDPDDRKKFQRDWESGKYANSDELNTAISKYHDKRRRKPEGPKPPGSAISHHLRSTTTVLTKVNGEMIPELLNKLNELVKRSEEPSERAAQLAKELKAQLPLTKQFMVEAEKAMKAAGL
jgi:hypothetical protein